MIIKIELDESQVAKYNAWRKEVDSRAVQKQKEKFKDNPSGFHEAYEYCWSLGEPYSGAIGGSETWSITHTSIGSVVKVKDAHVPDFELDLTDYDTW